MNTGELAGTEESALPREEDVPEGHIVRLPEPFSFTVDEKYDYLRRGFLKTFWYWLLRTAVHLPLLLIDQAYLGLRIRGRRNLCGARVTVMVCNHVHLLDCTFLDFLRPMDRIYYTTLESNFRIPVARHLIRWLGGVPIPERGVNKMRNFLKSMERALASGAIVCLYPEGVLYPYFDGVRRFRNGAFKIAADCGCGVTPAVITFRKRKGLYRLFRRKPCPTLTVLPRVLPDPKKTPRENELLLKSACLDEMRKAWEAPKKEA